jgi:hypothetical protein
MKLKALLPLAGSLGLGLAAGIGLLIHGKKKRGTDLFQLALTRKKKLRLSVYITVQAVQTCLNSPEGRREAISVLRSLGITKAYIESYRSGDVAEQALLETVRDYFLANGLKVAGGIAPTHGKDFGVRENTTLEWFNFQAAKTQADLEPVVRLTARVFDELIVDDMWCTADTSEMSQQAKGDRTWAGYRMDLMTELAEKLVLKPAREENSKISVILKYPQWYDRFHLYGYDVVREPKMFDKIWVGTETRGPDTQYMGFVKQYEGFINYKWLGSIAPEKVGGAWFDHIDCDEFDFIDQAYQTILAGAREIIFFNYFDLMKGHPGHHFLRRQFLKLIELAELLQHEKIQGIHAFKPANSDAGNDFYIYDYLGMLGLPLLPTAHFPENPTALFLPTQAAAAPDLVAKIEAALQSGQNVLLTPGLFSAIENGGRLEELAGVKFKKVKKVPVFIPEGGSEPIQLAAQLVAKQAKVLIETAAAEKNIPVFTVNTPAEGGKVFVLNVNTFSEADFQDDVEPLLAPREVSWLAFPDTWLNLIRRELLAPFNFEFNSPAKVTFYPIGSQNWVFVNFNNKTVEIEFKHKALKTGITIRNQFSGERLAYKEPSLKWKLSPREIVWLTIREHKN